MRGLLIGAGRLQEAAAILLAWAELVSEGMLPNRFPDGSGPPEYNAVDASLWFIVAAHDLIEAGGVSPTEAAHLRQAAAAILEGYTAGTRYGIAMDPADGLLRAGVPGVQLTWMDAKVGDWVVTPRIGKPVEVQALWVNALAIAGRWPGGDRWMAAGLRARDSVLAHFPDRATGGLVDVLDVDGVPGAVDRRVRPNQVLAAGGLPVPVLTPRLVAGRGRPGGAHPADAAGPAQPGPGRSGVLRPLHRRPARAGRRLPPGHRLALAARPVRRRLAGRARRHAGSPGGRPDPASCRRCTPHLQTAGLGHVSEVADGDAPHTPGGCPFQAWSLGALLQIEAMLAPAPTPP